MTHKSDLDTINVWVNDWLVDFNPQNITSLLISHTQLPLARCLLSQNQSSEKAILCLLDIIICYLNIYNGTSCLELFSYLRLICAKLSNL